MKNNLVDLVKLLLHKQPRTAASLADEMNVSVRSVKNYVKQINTSFHDAIHSSHKGYEIDPQYALKILEDTHFSVPQTPKDRCTFIITRLINHQKDRPTNLYDLCDELFVSLSTLKKDLQLVRKKLHEFDLNLVLNGEEVECEGLEKNKRKVLSSILYAESNVNFVNIESLQKSFLDLDIPFIKQTLLDTFDRYHYFINDYSLVNLILHITIAVDRIQNNNINKQKIQNQQAVRLHEFNLAREIAQQLESKFNIQFSDAEIYEMTLLIISRATSIDYKTINTTNLEDFVGHNCLRLVHLLIAEINAYYYIDLSEPEFLIRFALHIRNLLVRAKNNYPSRNPLADTLKTSCPLLYDSSVNLARIIREQTGIQINDDEIAYIAFHLGSALESQKNLTSKITTALYCPNYYDIKEKVTDAIQKRYSDDILIKYILTAENELDQIKDIDLIISTIPLSKPTVITNLTISLFLNQKDQDSLDAKISFLQSKKRKEEFETYLRQLIQPHLFEHTNQMLTQTSCIEHMVNRLEKAEYVEHHFIQEVCEREQISSTAFGSFAVPHAMKMNALKTGLCVLVSEPVIEWGTHEVHLVLMMCFNKNERYIFNEIYDPITMILSEPENVRRLSECYDYDEFISLMVNLL